MEEQQSCADGNADSAPHATAQTQHAGSFSTGEDEASRQVTPTLEHADELHEYPQAPVKRRRTETAAQSSPPAGACHVQQPTCTPTKSTPYIMGIIKSMQAMSRHKPTSTDTQSSQQEVTAVSCKILQHIEPPAGPLTDQARVARPILSNHVEQQGNLATPAAAVVGNSSQEPTQTAARCQQEGASQPSVMHTIAAISSAAWVAGAHNQGPEPQTILRAVVAPRVRAEVASPVWSPGARKRLRFDAGLDDSQAGTPAGDEHA